MQTPGSGGGGGWFGGAASAIGKVGAGGGSGFVFDRRTGTGCKEIDEHPLLEENFPALLNAITSEGENEWRGNVRITALLAPSEPPNPRRGNAAASMAIVALGSPRQIWVEMAKSL